MGFITPIFHSVGNLQLLSISLKIFSNEGSKKYRPCLIISFRIESMLLAFFVFSFDICSWISFGVIGFPKISSSVSLPFKIRNLFPMHSRKISPPTLFTV